MSDDRIGHGKQEIQVLSLKNDAGRLNLEEAQTVIQDIGQLERRIFPKHESLSSSLLQEVQRRNCCVLYAVCDSDCLPKQQQGIVAGYVMYSCAALVASITKLAVKENCRKRGCGEALLRAALQRIRGRRIGFVNLHVDTSREPALGLYRKLGFTVDALVKSYYAPGRDAYRMVLTLEDGSTSA